MIRFFIVFLLAITTVVTASEIKAKRKKYIESVDISQIRNDIPQMDTAENSPNVQNYTIQSRIVGGANVYTYKQANFVVGIYIEDEKWCGGCIISSDRVLTAGHCLYEKDFVKTYFGYIRLSAPPPESVSMTIHHPNFIIHSNFDLLTLKNDIAVIKLPQDLLFSGKIQRIPLLTADEASRISLDKGSAMLCGWGLTSNSDSRLADYLQYAIVKLIPYTTCSNYYPSVTSRNLCTVSNTNQPKGGCNGDSGGPLVVNVTGVLKLVGVVSFTSKNGCETMDPAGYTKVVSYLNWLCQVIGLYCT